MTYKENFQLQKKRKKKKPFKIIPIHRKRQKAKVKKRNLVFITNNEQLCFFQ
jgi:hypothetical protein